MTRRYLGALLLIPTLVWAQTPPASPGTPMLVPATGYFIQARTSAGVQVGSLYYAPLAEWVCDQPLSTPITDTVTNPNVMAIADVDHEGRECRLSIVTWRNSLPPGTRYTGWVGASAAGVGEVAVAPEDATYVMGIPDFTVVPFTSSLPAPTGGRLLP